MNKKYLKFFFLFFVSFDNSDISFPLLNREKLSTRYSTVVSALTDIKQQDALVLWTKAVSQTEPQYLKRIYSSLGNVIQNKQILNLAAHFFYTQQLEQARLTLEFYFFCLSSWLYELAMNPHTMGSDHQKMAKNMVQISYEASEEIRQCLQSVSDPLVVAETCFSPIKQSRIFDVLATVKSILQDKTFQGPASVPAYEGVIGGNQVELLNQNMHNAEGVEYLSQLTYKILNGKNLIDGKRYVDMSIDDYKSLMTNREAVDLLFTGSEGFPTDFDPSSPNFHKMFLPRISNNQEKNIFGEFYSSISQAKESIFIDVFFFGGSMGVFVAKKLIHLVQQNPNLKIYMLTDRWNTMSYAQEMNVGYRFLRAYAENFPEDRILLLPPNIFQKRTSLPEYVDLLFGDDVIRNIIGKVDLAEHFSVFPKFKSDHSKVIVVDGKNPDTGVAFVGSKNLTDTSGGVCYDEVLRIQGPGVAAILDSYYWDLVAAIQYEYAKGNKKYIQDLFQKGFYGPLSTKVEDTKVDGKVNSKVDDIAKVILFPVDILGRLDKNYGGIPKSVKKGNVVLQLGQNNFNGSIRNAHLQYIQTILSAQRQIIVNDQFLFDPLIVQALVQALNRNLHLKVYILLADLSDPYDSQKPFSHVPNIAFVEDLLSFGDKRVQMKWNKPPPSFLEALRNAKVKYSVSLSPEFHLKAMSIDGVLEADSAQCGQYSNEKQVVESDGMSAVAAISGRPILITGSANKDNLTMVGGFREFQVALFNDKVSSAKHDCMFWSRFKDPEHTEEIDPNNINLPPSLKSKGITESDFNSIIRQILKSAYNFRIL